MRTSRSDRPGWSAVALIPAAALFLGFAAACAKKPSEPSDPAEQTAPEPAEQADTSWKEVDVTPLLGLPPALLESGHLKLNVGYLPATHDALFFIAEAEGILEHLGVEVTARSYKNSPAALEALFARDIDLAIPGVAAPLIHIADGKPFSIVGGAAWNSAGVIVPRNNLGQYEIGIDSVAGDKKAALRQFEGKRIGSVRQASGDAAFRAALIEIGELDLDRDLTIVEYPSPVDVRQAVVTGTIDAGVVWAPHMRLAEKEGLATVLRVRDVMQHPCCRNVVNDERLQDPRGREAIVSFLEATIYARKLLLLALHSDDPNVAGSSRRRVIAAVQAFMPTWTEELIADELFTVANDGTEVSPELGLDDMKEYASRMVQTGRFDSAEQMTQALEKVNHGPYADALRRAGLDPGLAEGQGADGYAALDRALLIQLGLQ